MSFTKLNSNTIVIIYIALFLSILLGVYLYTSQKSKTPNTTYYVYPQNRRDGSNNLWYGLNAGGDYRGYGREYGGHLSPGRIYGGREGRRE